MKDGQIKLRLLLNNTKDYKILEKWYQEEKIYLCFEQKKLTYEEIKTKYFPRTFKNAKVPVFMIEYNHKPIGIIQYQLIDEENKKLYHLSDKNCYEIDIFIGEIRLHNKGIGRRSVNLLTKFLFEKKTADLLVMCPLKNNISAIRCYKSCGFKASRSFKTKDTIGNLQDYILMIKRKELLR